MWGRTIRRYGGRRSPRSGARSTGRLGLAVATAQVLLLWGTAQASAEEVSTKPRIEVAPGIYLASASESLQAGEAAAERARAPGTESRRETGSARTPRVVGGRTTKITRWPWQVSIGYLPIDPTDAFKNHGCGGSLVAPTVVVTAAHCMTLGATDFTLPPEQFQVVTGRTRLSSNLGREHELEDYFWFVDAQGRPLWRSATIEWDVVFILLDSPSPREPIKIAGPGEESVWAPGRLAFATGWGSTFAGTDQEIDELDAPQSDVLRQARMKMISNSECDGVYGPALFPEVMVCAGLRAGGVDVCAGDSGGPLVVPVARGGHRLIGDTSFAEGCGLPRTPGVYGRLAADPIREALAEGIRVIAGAEVIGTGATPYNRFEFGRQTRRYRARATKLTVRVPGRGKVLLHPTKRLRGAVVWPREAGRAHLSLEPLGKARRRLDRAEGHRTVRVPVRARVTYTPLGGKPRTAEARVWLARR